MKIFHQEYANSEGVEISHLLRSLPRYTAPAWLRRQVLLFCLDGQPMSRKEGKRHPGVEESGGKCGPR